LLLFVKSQNDFRENRNIISEHDKRMKNDFVRIKKKNI